MAHEANGAALAALETLARILAPLVAAEVVRELSRAQESMIDQARSPLGRRRHIALARELIAARSPDAAQIGRRYLIRREQVDARASAISQSKRPRAALRAADENYAVDALAARYGLAKTG